MPSKEDIPTFDEWKKQVMEVEMEKSECVRRGRGVRDEAADGGSL